MQNTNYITTVKQEYSFNYFVIPRELDDNPLYLKLSVLAKYLYGKLLNRALLSAKNHFLDKKGRAYIFFTREEGASLLNCSYSTITKVFKELRSTDLIEEKSQGKKKANMIFVKLPSKSTLNSQNRKKAKEAKKNLAQKRKEFLKQLNTKLKIKNKMLTKVEKCLSFAKSNLHNINLKIKEAKNITLEPRTLEETKLQLGCSWLTQHADELHIDSDILTSLTVAIAEMRTAHRTKVNDVYYTRESLADMLDTVNENTVIEFLQQFSPASFENVKNIKAYLKSCFINFLQEQSVQLYEWKQSLPPCCSVI